MQSNHAILVAAALFVAACSNDVTSSSNAPNGAGITPPGGAAVNASSKHLHVATKNSDVVWQPGPPSLPPGAEIAVLQGDRTKPEPFTLRLRFPNGYKIPPHLHPTTENVTVLQGAFFKGMGPQFVESELQEFKPGDFSSIPPNTPHYVMARGVTVVQVHGIGPFGLTYVDPADMPVR